MPCALGKVCDGDTVGDSLQSHKKREHRTHRLLLRQIQTNSDDNRHLTTKKTPEVRSATFRVQGLGVVIFCFFKVLYIRAGRRDIHQPTKGFEFVQLILRP